MRLLDRLGFEVNRVEAKELAVVGDPGFGPEPAADLQGFVQAATPGVRVEPGSLPFLAQPARADTDFGTPLGDEVQSLHGPGSGEGVSQAEEVDIGSQADPRGAGGQKREHREGVEDRCGGRDRGPVLARMRRTRHVLGEDQVLGKPAGFKAEGFGFDDGFPEKSRVQRAQGDSELHGPETSPGPAPAGARSRTESSTRRFFCRPAAVSWLAMGRVGPKLRI